MRQRGLWVNAVVVASFTDELHDAAAAGSALHLLAEDGGAGQGAGRDERVQQLGGRRAEHLLQQLQRGGHHVVVAVLRVVQRQLIHLRKEAGRGRGDSGPILNTHTRHTPDTLNSGSNVTTAFNRYNRNLNPNPEERLIED